MAITPEQRAKLLQLFETLNQTRNYVYDAYDTGLMVTAKDSVYDLWQQVDTDEILESETKQQLIEYLLAARRGISTAGGSSTEERAGRCLEQLGKVTRYLEERLK
ncbi:hypothetical protein NG799_24885 [Laspinema sp. D1]|uniref:Uncharacterized protein n=1 Tax=Laspinema palackyanum D2a TaxID=2953684 RepID=A0ABT2MXS7_9CYAN|nr:hypothetical protein [Laspinema sp. D2b]MCT7969552.1 hypothetical protein [Laspinema sp. D2a]